jgi:hypothetical protein
MRLLSPKIHGVLDYLAVALFVSAPVVFMINERTAAVAGCYAIAATLLVVSLLTRYPLGVVRVIPFTVHGALEFVTAPLMIAYPWMAGFADLPGPRNFFIVSGAALFALWAITDYKAADAARATTAAHAGPPRPAMSGHA